jgi:hypothetical protein
MDKAANHEFENPAQDSSTFPSSSITSNVAKYDEYLKDIKNKKNIKLKYLKDFLNSFHSSSNTAGSGSKNNNNHQASSLFLSESADFSDKKNESESSLNLKLNSELLDDLKSRKDSKLSSASASKKHRNSTAIQSSSNSTTQSLAHHSGVNSSIDLDYLTRKLESLQKSNSAYNLTPIQSSSNPIIKSSITTPAKVSTNPSASATVATTGGCKPKKLADLYLNDYKLNNKVIVSSSGKKENRPLSNVEQHHYYNIGMLLFSYNHLRKIE